MAPASRMGLAAAAAWSLCACQPRESPEATRQRSAEAFLLTQIKDLKALVARAEAGQLQTADRIAIGISEETVKAIIDAPLPREQALRDSLLVRVEKAQPIFRGNNAAILFEATARHIATGAEARLELGGRLVNFRVEDGRLRSDVELVHFKVLGSSLPELGSGVLERLVQDNLGALARLTPELEIPVRLEHTVAIDGLTEGVVRVKGGSLPLAMSVAEVVPSSARLWIFLEVKAGPWRPTGKAG